MYEPYAYQKATPENPYPGHILPLYLKLLPIIISALGLAIIASVTWPIVEYQFTDRSNSPTTDRYARVGLLSPIVDASSFPSLDTENGPQVVSDLDFTKASNWFAAKNIPPSEPTTISQLNPPPTDLKTFTISVPSLKLDLAIVTINGDDLGKSLVHFPGTALPGGFGDTVIFGHSTLPQLTKPNDYMSIFTYLPSVKLDDLILTNFNNNTYTYKVTKVYQVKPSDTWVLRQIYDHKKLKLITCVPPGTRLKRLIVEADLVRNI